MATKRPDGRVEPGQRISSAFSARAWNRAQDAADVVLGARTGATAGSAIAQPYSTLTLVISTSDYTASLANLPSEFEPKIGAAIDLPHTSFLLHPDVSPDDLQGSAGGYTVANENHLKPFSLASRFLRMSRLTFGMSESFGLLISFSQPAQGETDWSFTVAVGGVFSCLVYAFGTGPRVSGAFPVPPLNNDSIPRSMWRQYPSVGHAGSGVLLALGAHYKIVSGSQWPRLYEAVVRL